MAPPTTIGPSTPAIEPPNDDINHLNVPITYDNPGKYLIIIQWLIFMEEQQ